jgi:hypothetical protein
MAQKRNPENNTERKLTHEAVERILQHIKAIEDEMPFLINLTPREMMSLPKMNDHRHGFVRKALNHAKESPHILPDYVDIDEMEKGLELFEGLKKIFRASNKMNEKIRDTFTDAGSGSYKKGLNVFESAKLANKCGTPGTDFIVNDLKQYFKNNGKSRNENN